MVLSMSYLITVGIGPIFTELLSWLVYLNRGTVLLQLLLVGVVMLAEHRGALRRSIEHRQVPESIRVLIGPLLLLISSALFLVVGLPWGLLRYFGLLWLGWMLFTPLKELLLKINKKNNSGYHVPKINAAGQMLKPLVTKCIIRMCSPLPRL